jgi:sulfite exporter TauE/SafE
MSLYSPLLYDVMPGLWCITTNPLLNGMLYIVIHGLMTPSVMLIFVWLTYRNVKKSRQRVVNRLFSFLPKISI